MKMFMFEINEAVRLSAIENVQWFKEDKQNNRARVTFLTKQFIYSEHFESDQEAEEYFLGIIKLIESSDD